MALLSIDDDINADATTVKLLDRDSEKRLIWKLTRSVLETDKFKQRRHGYKKRRKWDLFETLMRIFGLFLRMTRMYERGHDNATRIVVNRVELQFQGLPDAFNGYTLLHLSDIHPDVIPGHARTIANAIRGLSCDACLMTGDFRGRTRGSVKKAMDAMAEIVDAIHARDGLFVTLGNHDTYLMVAPFERLNGVVLANESAALHRHGERIHITGIDDPYYYYTDQAIAALEKPIPGFKIAMVHTPSLFDAAADNGYDLYLCGHTHGGQICLPGGYPVLLHLNHGRQYYRGLWRYQNMRGYTSQGCGTVGLPIRFNTVSEVTLIRLVQG